MGELSQELFRKKPQKSRFSSSEKISQQQEQTVYIETAIFTPRHFCTRQLFTLSLFFQLNIIHIALHWLFNASSLASLIPKDQLYIKN